MTFSSKGTWYWTMYIQWESSESSGCERWKVSSCQITGGIEGEREERHSRKQQNKERTKTTKTSLKPKRISEGWNEKCFNLLRITTHRASTLLIQKASQRLLWDYSKKASLIQSALQSFAQSAACESSRVLLLFLLLLYFNTLCMLSPLSYIVHTSWDWPFNTMWP